MAEKRYVSETGFCSRLQVAHLSRFFLKEMESSLQNVFLNRRQDDG
jgi:hypothetical protein